MSALRSRRVITTAALLAVALLSTTACKDEGSPSASPAGSPASGEGNLFLNPGLEEGSNPWFTLDENSGFVRSQDQAHTGNASALLRMRDSAEADGNRVYYLIQELGPGEFPETLHGYYRVENWQRGTRKQYLQFVVIAFAPDNFPADASNYQIRYLLAGIDSPPFPIGNAHFVFLNKEEPGEGEWVRFETNLRDDFQRLWSAVPEGYDSLRILFEVRWDDKMAGDGEPQADVYYDDLYVGPAAGS